MDGGKKANAAAEEEAAAAGAEEDEEGKSAGRSAAWVETTSPESGSTCTAYARARQLTLAAAVSPQEPPSLSLWLAPSLARRSSTHDPLAMPASSINASGTPTSAKMSRGCG